MGLKQDIKDALLDNMADTGKDMMELSNFQVDKADELSQRISDAIINFLQKQTFTITRMKAALEVEELKTTSFLSDAAIQNATTISWPGGVTGPLQPVIINPLNLSKDSGQGGAMITFPCFVH